MPDGDGSAAHGSVQRAFQRRVASRHRLFRRLPVTGYHFSGVEPSRRISRNPSLVVRVIENRAVHAFKYIPKCIPIPGMKKGSESLKNQQSGTTCGVRKILI
ncbi:hypothetical protein ACK2E9_02415 [Bifidobacterium catenulatum]|uniref:hypothetical protein n=1 Tax=Bifidobacterium catenulatum TaxID=1686 RepID=UPI003D2F3756